MQYEPIYVALIALLPLAAFLLLGLGGRRIFREASGLLGTLATAVSFFLAAWVAYGYFFSWGKKINDYEPSIAFKIPWLSFANGLEIDMGVLLDPISVMMLVVVTFISLMVHVYSLSYMKGEDRYCTFFAYLSLFTFSMLGLVMSSNLFQMYIFWELVGVSSFLLIGFYYQKPSAVAAAKKAFIVTRFADLGFLIGILILSYHAHTLDFQTLIQRLTDPVSPQLQSALTSGFLGASALSWGLSLVFIGGAGKSALFPLHIWLPDAMEGPTPVSALIHAATMVVAGVFLVARLFPVYALSAPQVLAWIGSIGAVTALVAALIACTQTDIKRVLAYSTMSQIGFMVLALGVSGYGSEQGLGFTASQFHLFTHAMFKALLFLAAGVVIHHVHSNELADMGGLRKELPFTHLVFLIACLAIAGVPPLAGFFSKEEILLAAYQSNRMIFYLAMFTSFLTAFYMFRLYFSIFWHRPAHGHGHGAKEGSMALLLPLGMLALGSIGAGFIPFGKFVTSDGLPLASHFSVMFSIAPVLLGLAGIILAWWMYRRENAMPGRVAQTLGTFYEVVRNKFYIDELYQFVTKQILFPFVGRPAAWFDRQVVDGLVNLTGNATLSLSERIKAMQSGKVQAYALVFLAGLILLAIGLIYL
jgi:NADH-quinone oxidoreductase subunit L